MKEVEKLAQTQEARSTRLEKLYPSYRNQFCQAGWDQKKQWTKPELFGQSKMWFGLSKVLQPQPKRPLCKQLHQISKKLVLVMATFALVIEASKKNDVIFDWISSIHYQIWFKKNMIQAIIDFGNEINTMTPRYTSKLGLKVRLSKLEAQRINSSIFKTFIMVLASFQVENKLARL